MTSRRRPRSSVLCQTLVRDGGQGLKSCAECECGCGFTAFGGVTMQTRSGKWGGSMRTCLILKLQTAWARAFIYVRTYGERRARSSVMGGLDEETKGAVAAARLDISAARVDERACVACSAARPATARDSRCTLHWAKPSGDARTLRPNRAAGVRIPTVCQIEEEPTDEASNPPILGALGGQWQSLP